MEAGEQSPAFFMDKITLEDAHKLHLEGKIKEAEEKYVLLLNKNYENYALLQYLGVLYTQTGRNGLAIAVLRRSIELKKDCSETWNNLGLAYLYEHAYDKAKSCYYQALRYVKEDDLAMQSKVYGNVASVSVNEGRPGDGIPDALKALKYDNTNVGAHWNLALMYLEMGNFRDGFREYEWGLLKTANGKEVRHLREYAWEHLDGTKEPTPWWDGTPNKTVVVYGEQGVGDEIMFASCLEDLRKVCKEVIFDCHPRLVRLFGDSFPGLTLHGTRKDDTVLWRDQHRIDYKLAIGSLPYWFRRDGFPVHNGYLKAKPTLKSGRPKIGLGWVGGSKTTRIELRSMRLPWLLPILQQDADFYSLQYGDSQEEIEWLEKEHGIKIIQTGQERAEDYGECADLVAGLDLVIAVNTSAVHLAGALGVPCWTLTPNKPAWRYGITGEGMVWYPSVRQFRQGDETWGPVIDRVANELKDYLANFGRVQEAQRAVA